MTLPWIPVSQSLPDDDETVLIYSPGQSDPVWMGWHEGDQWFNVDATVAEGVEAWAPMPQGPR